MMLVNNSERAIFIAGKLLVPTVPIEVEEIDLEHPRVMELIKGKELKIITEVDASE
jgi:hypothetical protein